jgi:hypothetical protein
VGVSVGVATSALALAACGRHATQADCQLIVDRSVELQMKETGVENDASAIQKRKEQVRAELDDEIKNCETRRVTDKTMACVRDATSSAELDQCLR